jgi:Flp pilus assembly CpaE family ATPase
MKSYTLATEVNGTITALDLPLMSMRQAKRHLDRLKALAPSAAIYIINPNAI